MDTKVVRSIFRNILFVISILLIVFSFTNLSLTIARSIVFEKYPLASWEETRCEMTPPLPTISSEKEFGESISPAELETRKKDCEKSLSLQRKTKQVEDFVTHISILFLGTLLASMFKGSISK